MSYAVELSPNAMSGLSQLDARVARMVGDKIDWLADNADSIRHEQLKGRFSAYFRLRVGDYRVIYEFDREERRITVHAVRHRRVAYR